MRHGATTACRPRSLAAAATVVCAAALVAPAAAAALPAVTVSEVTASLANTTAHTGVTVTASCSSGALVGGGSYLRNATDPSILPTNGLVLGGQAPSTGASPVDGGVANGATDPSHWFTDANFTGVADPANTDEAETFALCASGGTSSTVLATASTSGADDNSNQQVSAPIPATATCPAGSELIGGGAVTTTPDQVNDGTTVGNEGNLKPLASYPSDATGVAAADGSTTATSWSAYGSAGIQNGGGGNDVVTAYALCSTDASPPAVQVVRTDVDGPVAQPGTTTIAGSSTCPSGTRLIGGGYGADETAGATSGLQPQQGYHLRGSYPSASSASSVGGTPPPEVGNGASDPQTWTAVLQLGGQTLPAGDYGTLHVFAMCQMAPPPPGSADLSVSLSAAPSPAVVGDPLTYTLGVANAGPADATGVVATAALPSAATFVSATSTAATCGQSAGLVTCTVGKLAAGASATVTVVVTPTQPVELVAGAAVSGDQTDGDTANNSAALSTMADLASRATTTLGASPTSAILGGGISDAVTLAGGSSPTGTIAFALYGPGDTTCAVALATSTASVAGDGAYASAPYTPTQPGTYRWVAGYGGDGVNAPAGPNACGDPSQTISVLDRPTLSVRATVSAGPTITAEATLAGGARPTGTISLRLYGPADTTCSHSLASTTAAVSGNGIYGSRPYSAATPGTYRWVAVYSGDVLNTALGPTACAGAEVTVTRAGRAPSNRFGLLGRRTTPGGRIILTVSAPGPGSFRALATIESTRRRGATVRYAVTGHRDAKAGRLTLVLIPARAGRALRRRYRHLKVSLAVTFTPAGGKPSTRHAAVTVPGQP